MYARFQPKTRGHARFASDFPCSSCGPLQERAQAQAETFAASEVSIGLAPQIAESIQNGTFNRNFYRKVDQMYGAYCKKMATIGAARRYLSNSGKALKQKNYAVAIGEMEKAAVAMDVNGSSNAKQTANAIDNAARYLSESVETILPQGNERKVAKNVQESIESLEKGDLANASAKLVDVAKDLEKRDKNLARVANSVNKVAANLVQAANGIEREQRNAIVQRKDVDLVENTVNDGKFMSANQKQAIEIEANRNVVASIEEVVQVRNSNSVNAAPALNASHQTPAVDFQAPVSSAIRDKSALNNASAKNVVVQNQLSFRPVGPSVYERACACQKSKQIYGADSSIATTLSNSASMAASAQHQNHIASIYQTQKPVARSQCSGLAKHTEYRGMIRASTAHDNTGAPNSVDQWKSAKAISEFNAMSAAFGAPDFLLNQSVGGSAVWHKRSVFDLIRVTDVDDHGEAKVVTLTVRPIDIAHDEQQELAQLAPGSVGYDAIDKVLFAQGKSSGEVVALLIVALDVARDNSMTLQEAQQALPEMIDRSKAHFDEMLEILSADLRN